MSAAIVSTNAAVLAANGGSGSMPIDQLIAMFLVTIIALVILWRCL